MAFLGTAELKDMGFRSLGRGVQISTRAAIYNPELISIGDHSRIDDFCVVSGQVTIGRNVHIAVQCNVAGGEDGIEFADFSGFAYAVQVFTKSDDYSGSALTNPTVPDQYCKVHSAAVRIGRHVIVGAQSVIFPGVDLADGCAVGAASVVNRSTKPWSIYTGTPARLVKARSQDLLKLEARYLESERKAAELG